MNYLKYIDIIIPTSDTNSGLFKNCFKLVNKTTKQFNTYISTCNANEGFSKAINKAIKMVNSEYICLLNDDTEPQKDWLLYLINKMEEDGKIGICGSKLLYPDGLIQCAGVRHQENNWPCLIGNKQNDSPEYNIPKEVESLTFASVVLRKEMIDKIGRLDEQYLYYFEDTDYCLRAKQAGWKIFYEPKSVVYHYESKTISDRLDARKIYLESEKKFLDKWNKEEL